MRFLILPPAEPAADGRADEDLIPQAAALGPVARVWDAPQGLVVPRTYAALPGFERACAVFADEGWPVSVRQSGGGVVPQGRGILNLSLAVPVVGRPLDHSEALYRLICEIIQAALAPMGIEARTEAVAGSFCDGRFNLAVGMPARKIVGTAQVWRRVPHGPPQQHVGLAHALILAQVDTGALTARANQLEAMLGTDRRYQPERIASVDGLVPDAGPDVTARLAAALSDALGNAWPGIAPGR